MSDTFAAAEFKAKCLALIDRVRERGEPITITKRGRVGEVAMLVDLGRLSLELPLLEWRL